MINYQYGKILRDRREIFNRQCHQRSAHCFFENKNRLANCCELLYVIVCTQSLRKPHCFRHIKYKYRAVSRKNCSSYSCVFLTESPPCKASSIVVVDDTIYRDQPARGENLRIVLIGMAAELFRVSLLSQEDVKKSNEKRRKQHRETGTTADAR